MYLTGEVPRLTPFEAEDKRLMVKKDGKLTNDRLKDDQSLVIKTPEGLVILLGCAHSGIINILNHIKNKMPGQKIHMIIGGTHLGPLTEDQIQQTIKSLKSFSFDRLGVSHCTGLKASMKFMHEFPERFFFANAGSVIKI